MRLKALLSSLMISMAAQVGAQAPAAGEVERFRVTPARTIVLEGVRIIDGTGAPPRVNQTLVLRDGRIAAVGPTGRVRIPEGAERHRLTGRTVLPGLVMLHEHMMYFSGQRTWHSQPVSYPRLYLAAGVTTIRTAGGDFPYVDLNLADRIAAGRIVGPRMFVTSPNLNGPEDPFLGDVIIRDAAAAHREIDYWAARGVTSFKAYAGLNAELLGALIARARERRLILTAHLGRTSCTQAVELGIANIEHSFLSCLPELGMQFGPEGNLVGAVDPERARALIRLLVERGVVLTSTPMALDDPTAEVRALLHPAALANWESGRGRPPPAFLQAEAAVRRLERDFVAAGGRMVIGADAENFARIAGFANVRALVLLVEAGHTPLDVIRMATSGGAQFLGIGSQTGSIAVGMEADLLIVNGDPSAAIADIGRVHWVVSDGVIYDPVRLRASVTGLVGWH